MIFEHKKIDFTELETTTIHGKRHYVTPKGFYPSITTALSILSSEGIAAWRMRVGEKEANRISTQAARRGTNVHQMCEDYVNNELDLRSFLPHERAMFNSVKGTLDESLGLVYAQECPLYSDYLGIAGRVDCVAEFNGRLSIIDYKTSSKIKSKKYIGAYFQQAAAYCVMFEERTGIPIDQIVIIIAVEGETEPQVFIEKRDDHIGDCINTIARYTESVGA
jgi:CRISPR/Cas system-associated exonuclease Cas4 (RecB family)